MAWPPPMHIMVVQVGGKPASSTLLCALKAFGPTSTWPAAAPP